MLDDESTSVFTGNGHTAPRVWGQLLWMKRSKISLSFKSRSNNGPLFRSLKRWNSSRSPSDYPVHSHWWSEPVAVFSSRKGAPGRGVMISNVFRLAFWPATRRGIVHYQSNSSTSAANMPPMHCEPLANSFAISLPGQLNAPESHWNSYRRAVRY